MSSNAMENAIIELIRKSPNWQALAAAIVSMLGEAEANGLADSYGRAGLLENAMDDEIRRWIREWEKK